MRPAATWSAQVAAWMVIFAAGAALAAAVVVPRVAGATPYTILTGSMRPSLPPGTLVVVKRTDVEEIAAGDVITYQLKSGQPTVVTHRVVNVGHKLDGTYSIVTKGDANNVADAKPVMPIQIKGKVWYSVPYLGYVNNALTGSQRQIVTYGIASLLALYAAYMFTTSSRDRRNEERESEEVTL